MTLGHARRRRVRFVNIHAVREPAPEEDWLRRNAAVARELRFQTCHLFDFIPRGFQTFGVVSHAGDQSEPP
jgi:hypothetical protein